MHLCPFCQAKKSCPKRAAALGEVRPFGTFEPKATRAAEMTLQPSEWSKLGGRRATGRLPPPPPPPGVCFGPVTWVDVGKLIECLTVKAKSGSMGSRIRRRRVVANTSGVGRLRATALVLLPEANGPTPCGFHQNALECRSLGVFRCTSRLVRTKKVLCYVLKPDDASG